MRTLTRIAVPGLNAIFVACLLIYLMYLLIKTEEPELQRRPDFKVPPITYKPVEEKPKIIVVRPTPPPEAQRPPSMTKSEERITLDGLNETTWAEPSLGSPRDLIAAPVDNQLVLILGYPPVYPHSQIAKGTEGYAIVGFSVAADGSVFNAYIIESEPGSVFDKASLKAIEKFKYKPKHVGGKPIATENMQTMFTYKLD